MAKYFSPQEFIKCNPSCRIEQMNPEFLELLDEVRETAGIPLVLNSAFRTKSYEQMKGRSGNSAHTRGLAVDIRCKSHENRFRIIQAAILCGVRRIGIGKTFIHLDVDKSLPQSVIWDYYD